MPRQNLPLEKVSSIKYFLYPILGMSLFYINSRLELNYFIKGYLSFIELQIAVIAIYLITSIRKNNKSIKK